jgi:hypothetical protein
VSELYKSTGKSGWQSKEVPCNVKEKIGRPETSIAQSESAPYRNKPSRYFSATIKALSLISRYLCTTEAVFEASFNIWRGFGVFQMTVDAYSRAVYQKSSKPTPTTLHIPEFHDNIPHTFIVSQHCIPSIVFGINILHNF